MLEQDQNQASERLPIFLSPAFAWEKKHEITIKEQMEPSKRQEMVDKEKFESFAVGTFPLAAGFRDCSSSEGSMTSVDYYSN